MTFDEMIAVLQAAKEGKQIEYRNVHREGTWLNATFNHWDFFDYEYRIKSEPRECWVAEKQLAGHLDKELIEKTWECKAIRMREVL